MMQLKGCPRCHGDLVMNSYLDEYTANCLQCGYSRAMMAPAPQILARVTDETATRQAQRTYVGRRAA